jgi:hypothetical protein
LAENNTPVRTVQETSKHSLCCKKVVGGEDMAINYPETEEKFCKDLRWEALA